MAQNSNQCAGGRVLAYAEYMALRSYGDGQSHAPVAGFSEGSVSPLRAGTRLPLIHARAGPRAKKLAKGPAAIAASTALRVSSVVIFARLVTRRV